MPSNSSSRKPGSLKPDTLKLLNSLGSQELVDAADTCRVVWAKVKGHPYWPVCSPLSLAPSHTPPIHTHSDTLLYSLIHTHTHTQTRTHIHTRARAILLILTPRWKRL
jgi:hypothetical protein